MPKGDQKKPIDLTGQRFGRLVALKNLGRKSAASRAHRWECVCACGVTTVTTSDALRSGETKSCGCLQRERASQMGRATRTHGFTDTSTYHIWNTMVQRCTNPNRADFPRYGGRGITVCERWLKFDAFLADMGSRPSGQTLDRKDNDQGYGPSNCRWLGSAAQQRNKSNNKVLTYAGQSKCLTEWAEQLRINKISLEARLRRGWSVERSLSEPIDRRFSRG